jgi:tRNA(Ile)-lysidine synthase
MESSKKGEGSGARQPERRVRRRFTPDALAHVLSAKLQLTSDIPLYVAYSGGMDSHALLHAAAQLRRLASWKVTALHVDHGLQPHSSAWERHCAAVCAALGVPYQSERVSVRDIAARGLEDAAREARYAALAARLPPGGVLLTAHHQDDQAETMLLQLFRGAGVAGLAGMPAIAEFGDGRLARPLLGFERQALASYAQTQRLQWIEDASNQDEELTRNFLRHRVWPVIAERWPQVAERLALAASHQGAALRLLDQLAAIDLAPIATADGELNIELLLQFAPDRQANLLRYWIRTGGMNAPSERVLQQILARVGRCPVSRHALIRWGNAEVRRYRNRLVLQPWARPVPAGWEATWDPTTTLEIPATGWSLRAQTTVGSGLSRSRIGDGALHVRFRRGGERCRVRGHTHKVKKLLQEAGVPPWERARLPLVYVGAELAAIGDRWVCEPYAAHPEEPGMLLVLDGAAAR